MIPMNQQVGNVSTYVMPWHGLLKIICANNGHEARLLFKHFSCKARLFVKHVGCKARVLCKNLGNEGRALFKCFGFEARLLFKRLGATQDFCSKIFDAKEGF